MSLCQWADWYHNCQSVGLVVYIKEGHPGEYKGFGEETCNLSDKTPRCSGSSSYWTWWGFPFAQLLFRNHLFSILQAIQTRLIPSPQTRSTELTSALLTRSWPTLLSDPLGTRCSPSAAMARWAACEPGAPKDHLCHPWGHSAWQWSQDKRKQNQETNRWLQGNIWGPGSSPAWRFPLFFSYLSK